ncbi:MAG TPA: sulfatase/phosphatase domain-containing protein, partial [Draconibacterium sp.]|nr:sulfatase/phosphatase domain-containing protein [Draconibacterium sp.]
LIVKIPGNSNNGKRTAELVTLADVLPTLIDVLDLKLPETKYPVQGESLAKVITGKGSINRDYIVSESWSQACVITKNSKLGIMLDPTIVHPNFDYREFGDMFFNTKNDPFEVENRISDKKYRREIIKLRGYYDEYIKNTPSTGKELMIRQKQQNK